MARCAKCNTRILRESLLCFGCSVTESWKDLSTVMPAASCLERARKKVRLDGEYHCAVDRMIGKTIVKLKTATVDDLLAGFSVKNAPPKEGRKKWYRFLSYLIKNDVRVEFSDKINCKRRAIPAEIVEWDDFHKMIGKRHQEVILSCPEEGKVNP